MSNATISLISSILTAIGAIIGALGWASAETVSLGIGTIMTALSGGVAVYASWKKDREVAALQATIAVSDAMR